MVNVGVGKSYVTCKTNIYFNIICVIKNVSTKLYILDSQND